MITYFTEPETAEQAILRLGYKASGMSRGIPQRPEGADQMAAEAERVISSPEAGLTHDDVDAALHELAGERGEEVRETQAQVLRLTGGEKDVGSMVNGIMALSAMGTQTVSEDRARLADYAALSASGHGSAIIGGESALRKLAEKLGIDVTKLPGFKGDLDQKAADARHAAMQALQLTASDVLALSRGEDDELAGRVELAAAGARETEAERKIRQVLERNGPMFRQAPKGRRRSAVHVHDGGMTHGAEHPTGRKITTETRAHSNTSGFGGADAVMARNPEFFGREEGSNANRRIPPRGTGQRQSAETRALAHGRHQSKIKEQ